MSKGKILLIDVYPDVPYRVCKDLAGGYGTGNDFGSGLIPGLLKRFVKRSINFPQIQLLQVAAILRDQGYDVVYTQDKSADTTDAVACIFASSIVAHETEVEAIEDCRCDRKFAIGIVAQQFRRAYEKAGAYVVPEEAEAFFQHVNLLDFPDFPKQRYFVDNLDDLPYPAWDIFLENHSLSNIFIKRGGLTIPIYATKGCPYSCSFYCTYPLQQGKKVRSRSIDNIVAEIEFWNAQGVKNFLFRDPVFSINKKHTIQLAEALIEKNLGINYMVETHLNNVDEMMADLLSKSGLSLVYVGVESVDANVLQDMKRFTLEKEKEFEKIQMLRRNNIKVKAMFILGCPEDTVETVNKTIQFAIDLKPNLAQFSVFTPYPGTPNFENFKDKITASHFQEFDQYRLVFNHKNLSGRQVRDLLGRAYRKFYLRFGFLGELAAILGR